MTEEVKEQAISEEAKQEIGDASAKRINAIYKMVREYFRALNNGTLSSTEFMMIGSECLQAGLLLISRSNDMDMADVDTRIGVMKSMQDIINKTFETVYLNPEIVAKQVAKASVEAAERKGLAK